MSNNVQDVFTEAIGFESSRLAHFGQSGHIQSFQDAVSSITVDGVVENEALKQAKEQANDVVRDALDGFMNRVLGRTSQPS